MTAIELRERIDRLTETIQSEIAQAVGADKEQEIYQEQARKLIADASKHFEAGNLELANWLYRYAQGCQIVARKDRQRVVALGMAIDKLLDEQLG